MKIVNVETGDVIYARDHSKPVKHVSWCPTGELLLTLSCTDGSIYAYEVRDKEAFLVKKLPAIINALETDADQTTRAVWHPDGKAFAVSLPIRGLSWDADSRMCLADVV